MATESTKEKDAQRCDSKHDRAAPHICPAFPVTAISMSFVSARISVHGCRNTAADESRVSANSKLGALSIEHSTHTRCCRLCAACTVRGTGHRQVRSRL